MMRIIKKTLSIVICISILMSTFSILGVIAPESFIPTVSALNETYTLTFDANGGYFGDGTSIITVTIQSGQSIDFQDIPSKDGFEFVGWDNEVPDVMPAEDLSFKALWDEVQIGVHFMIDDNTELAFCEGAFGDKIYAFSSQPEKNGFTFKGWKYADGSSVKFPVSLGSEAVYVYADWEAKGFYIEFYAPTESDWLDGGNQLCGEPIVAPAAPTKNGYTFVGWFDADGNPMPENVPAIIDQAYYGRYELTLYDAVFNVDGKEYYKFSGGYQSSIAAPEAPSKEGYSFNYWTKQGSTSKVIFPQRMPVGGVNFNAKFTVNKYTITYMVDDAVVKTETYEYGATITPFKYTPEDGFGFTGWRDIVPETMPANNLVFTGRTYDESIVADATIETYEELEAMYGQNGDGFVYTGIEFYEADGELTDYYVQPGDELVARVYVKSNMLIGNANIFSLYDNKFFDVSTAAGPDVQQNSTAYYFLNYTGGTINVHHPARVNNGAGHTITAAQCNNGSGWIRNVCGFTTEFLSETDYVHNILKQDVSVSSYAFDATSDDWLFEYYVKVKPELADGSVGIVSSPDVLWQSSINPTTGKHDIRKQGGVPVLDPADLESGYNSCSDATRMSLAMDSGLLDYFISDDMERVFVIGGNPVDIPEGVDRVSKIDSYADLLATYGQNGDNFAYAGLEFYEADGKLTDYYVEAGDELTARLYIKSNLYMGESYFVTLYDNTFFDVKLAGGPYASLDANGYTSNYARGTINAAHPVKVNNNAGHTITSISATKVGIFKQCGFTTEYLNKTDLVRSNTKTDIMVSSKAYDITSDEWLFEYYVKVKDGLADGTTGIVESPEIIWHSYIFESIGKHDARKPGYINVVDPAKGTAPGLSDASTMAAAMDSGILDTFIKEDLEHEFVIGSLFEKVYEYYDGFIYYIDRYDNAVIYRCDKNKVGVVNIPLNIKGYPVTEISENAFADCDKISEVIIPDTVNVIGENAFYNCSLLTSVKLGSGVSKISNNAFGGYAKQGRVIAYKSTQNNWNNVNVASNAFLENEIVICSDSFVYEVVDGNVTITGYSSEFVFPSVFTIPSTINDYPVTGIGNMAFSGVNFTTIYIPSSVKVIDRSAFSSCENLVNVYFSEGLETIGQFAFSNCYSLVSIELPSTVRSIGNNAFLQCSELKSAKFSEGIISVGNAVFNGCYSLTSFEFPADWTSIPGGILAGCTALKYVIIYSDVLSVGSSSFNNCISLTDVYFIGYESEWQNISIGINNTYLESAEIHCYYNAFGYSIVEDGIIITSSDSDAFIGTVLEIPSEIDGYKVVGIGYEAFQNNNNISKVIIPEGVKSVDDFAFYNFQNLNELVLPLSLTRIGEFAFSRSNSELKIYFAGSKTEWELIEYNPDSNCYFETAIFHYGKYVATWDIDGEILIQEIAIGDSVIPPEISEKTGYTFVGWSPEIPELMTETDLHFVAVFEPNIHTVTYMDDDNIIYTQYVYFGESIFEFEPNSKVGYTFYGWDCEIPEAMPDEDLVFKAVWQINVHSVTWVYGDGESSVSEFNYGEEIVMPETPTQTGYTFVAWLPEIPETMPDEDLVFFAAWTLNEHKITWNIDDEQIFTHVPYGTRLKKEFADFISTFDWRFSATASDVATPDEPYWPEATPSEPVVPDYPEQDEFIYNYVEDTSIVPACPEKYGYTFKDWSPEVPEFMPDNELEFTATWTPNPYEIRWHVDGETITTIQRYEEQIVPPDAPEIEGCGFLGWTPEIPETMPANELDFYGIYAPISGTCGYDMTWSFDVTTGTLTIVGTGYMGYYWNDSYSFWSDTLKPYIKSVVISEGVGDVNSYAFENCVNLVEVSLPESLRYIEYAAFGNCESLESIYIPSNVYSIDSSAFYGCKSLKEFIVDDNNERYSNDECGVLFNKDKSTLRKYPAGNETTEYVIPDSVTYIISSAFYDCDLIESVEMPDSVTSVGSGVFSGCDNLQFVKLSTSLDYISDSMFNNCVNLRTVELHDGLIYIGSNTFYNCDSLESVEMPDSVTSVGYDAFSSCDNLQYVRLSESLESIGSYAFYNCDSLESIVIPDSVFEIEDYAFAYCDDLYQISISDNVRRIGVYAFDGTAYDNNTEYIDGILYLGNHVIDVRAFHETYHYRLQYDNLTVREGTVSIADCAFADCYSDIITLPEGLKSIGDNAFEDCYVISEFDIPDSVSIIGSGAFNNSTIGTWDDGLHYVDNCLVGFDYDFDETVYEIKDGTVTIADSIFKYYHYPDKIIVPNSVKNIGRESFRDISTVILGNGIEYIGKNAFSDYYSYDITDIFYVGSEFEWSQVEFEDRDSTLADCNVYFDVSELRSNDYYDYAITSRDTAIILKYYENGRNTTSDETEVEIVEVFEIPETIDDCAVEAIGNEAFFESVSFRKVVVPETVNSIGDGAFIRCYNLSEINIPDAVTRIGINTFYGCPNLATVILGDGIKSFGMEVFECYNDYDVADLTIFYKGTESDWNKIEIDENNYRLNNATVYFGVVGFGTDGDYYYGITADSKAVILEYLGNETEVVIPQTLGGYPVASIGRYSFVDKGIMSVVVPDGVTSIGDGAFRYNWNLSSVEIPDSVTEIGDEAFYDIAIREIELPSRLETIGESAFASCNYLQYVVIPEGVTEINNSTFEYCWNLSYIVLPVGINDIKDNAFNNCGSLDNVFYEGSEEEWQSVNIGENNENLLNANIYFGIVRIMTDGDYTFAVTIDDEAIIVGYNGEKKNVDVPELLDGYTVTAIGSNAFYNCDAVTVTIPDSVTKIGSYAFDGCYYLTSVTLPRNLTEISDGLFAGCDELSNIIIPSGVKKIGNAAFRSTGLGYVIIPDGVTSIGQEAFLYSDLVYADIPDSVEFIGSEAFDSTQLQTVYYSGTEEEWNQIEIEESNEKLNSAEIIFESKIRTAGDFVFVSISETDAKLIGYTGSSVELVIPSRLAGHYITEIEQAFKGNSTLKSVTVPATVTKLGDFSFYGCSSLETVKLPEGLLEIGMGVFYACIELKNLDIPSTVTVIGMGAFMACVNLEDISIPEGVTRIEHSTFLACSKLESMILHNGIEYVGETAFALCLALKEVTLPENLKTIEDGTFMYCAELREITIPETVERIGYEVFGGCLSLEEFHIPESVAVIEDYVFSGCSGLREITVDPENEYFASDEFGVLYNKDKSVLLLYPISNERTTFTVPEGVTTVLSEAFSGHTYIITDLFNGDGYTYSVGNLREIILPDTVTSIDSWAFNDIKSLKLVHIPSSVTELPEYSDILDDTDAYICSDSDESVIKEYAERNGIEFRVCDGHDYEMSISDTEVTVYNKETLQLSATVTPNYTDDSGITWSSSDESVATVDENGFVTTHSAGETTVTAESFFGDISVECVITVLPAEFDVTWYIEDEIIKETYVEGTQIVPPAAVKEGYTFIGWTPEVPDVMPSYDVEFVAMFEINTYTVTWSIDGFALNETYQYGDKINIDKNFTKTGYSFGGWTPEVPETMPAYDAVFTATWTPNPYEAVFNGNGGTWSDGTSIVKIMVDYNSPIVLSETPVREGYEFGGWAVDGINIGTNIGIMDSIDGKIFDAVWLSNKTATYKIETYLMNTVGTYDMSSVTVKADPNEYVTVSPTIGNGFKLNETLSILNGTANPNGSLVLKVYIDRELYDFTYIVDGVRNSKLYYYGSVIPTPLTPKKSGHVFTKWSPEIPATIPANNLTVTAQFRVKTQEDCVTESGLYLYITPLKNVNLMYGESLTLNAYTGGLPKGYKVKWSVDSTCVTIETSADTLSCVITSKSTGNVAVKAWIVDAYGNKVEDKYGDPLTDTEVLYSDAGLWARIVWFFNRIFKVTSESLPQFFKVKN